MAVISSLCNQVLRLSGRLRLSAHSMDAEDGESAVSARRRKAAGEVRNELAKDDFGLDCPTQSH